MIAVLFQVLLPLFEEIFGTCVHVSFTIIAVSVGPLQRLASFEHRIASLYQELDLRKREVHCFNHGRADVLELRLEL